MTEEEWVPEALGTQHVPIVNSIDHGDYKQALKLVTKRLQKKTDDTYFRVSISSASAMMVLPL